MLLHSPEMRRLESGEKLMAVTVSVWLCSFSRRCRLLKDGMSQIMTLLSAELVARYLPSGLKAQHVTTSLCPRTEFTRAPL